MNGFFYKGKRARSADSRFARLLTASVLGAILCMGCLVGATWAWFTSNQNAAVATLRIATVETSGLSVVASYPDHTPFLTYQQALEVDPAARPAIPERLDWVEDALPVDEVDARTARFEVDANIACQLQTGMDTDAASAWMKVETPDGDFFTRDKEIECKLVFSEEGWVVITACWGPVESGLREFSDGDVLGRGEEVTLEQLKQTFGIVDPAPGAAEELPSMEEPSGEPGLVLAPVPAE